MRGPGKCAAVIRKREERSLEDFYINLFGRKLYSLFFESCTAKLWGRSAAEISPDWGAQRVKGLSIRALLGDVLAKRLQQYRPRPLECRAKTL